MVIVEYISRFLYSLSLLSGCIFPLRRTPLKQLTPLPPLVFDIEANNLEQLDVEHVNIHVRWDRGLGRPVTSCRTLRRV